MAVASSYVITNKILPAYRMQNRMSPSPPKITGLGAIRPEWTAATTLQYAGVDSESSGAGLRKDSYGNFPRARE